MLGEHPVNIVLLATDLDASKHFYANKVGLNPDQAPTRRAISPGVSGRGEPQSSRPARR